MGYTIADGVSETMDAMQYLHTPLKRDLINFSALAREIKPLVEQKLGYAVGLDAVIMAIRRYSDALRKRKESPDFVALLSQCNLIVRTGMAGAHFRRTPEVFQELRDLNGRVNWQGGEKMYVIQRSDEVSVFTTEKFLPKLLELGEKHEGALMQSWNGLALITVSFPPEGLKEPGLIAFFGSEISEARVPTYAVFSTHSMASFLVNESDAAKVYERVNNAIYESKALNAELKQTSPFATPYGED